MINGQQGRKAGIVLLLAFVALALAHPLLRLAGVAAVDLTSLDDTARILGVLMAGAFGVNAVSGGGRGDGGK